MHFENHDGKPIRSLKDWERLGGPASRAHWKAGRSAYELATDWVTGDAPSAVTDLLGRRPELAGLDLIAGVAEKKSQFDDDSRGPRNHDLLVRGRTAAGPVTIGVEGKADEPFDLPVWLYRERALKRSRDTGALSRVDRLVKRWFGTSLSTDTRTPPLACLSYQLFSGLAGTLADAAKDGSPTAVLLVHEFVTELTDDALHERNARSLDDFLERLAGPAWERTTGPGGWVTAPFSVAGDGKWMPNQTDVFVAKLTRNRRSTPSEEPSLESWSHEVPEA